MGLVCYGYTSSTSFGVRNDVKCVRYIVTAGGGGGARPRAGYGRAPSGGGYSCAPGAIAYGGAAGCLNSGGSGGYGNYSYGQNGYVNYSNGEYARANSGYGPRGYGGAGQWRSPSFTGGGGGGGASIACANRGYNGAVANNSYYLNVGNGGQQGGNGYRRFGDSGAVSVWVWTYDTPSVSVSISPTTITEGQSATLSWSTSGDVTSVSIDQLGGVGTSGSTSVSPSSSTRYTVTASNPVYNRSSYVDLTVYRVPTAVLVTTPSSIIIGSSAKLNWSTQFGNTASIDNGIGTVNLNGETTVSPTVDTVYTLSVTGNGGSSSDTALLTVVSIPTLVVTTPGSVTYGDSITIEVSGTNGDPSGNGLTVVIVQTDENQGPGHTSNTISIPNTTGDSFSATYTISASDIVYDDYGPGSIELQFNLDGYGSLFVQENRTINIDIDQMPDQINIPSSEGKFQDEAPVITPDVQVTSEQLVITDVDIPVEVKSNSPIQIEIDNDDIWYNIRQI